MKKENYMNKICYFSLATFSKTGGIENYNKRFLQALNDCSKLTTSVSVHDNTFDIDLTNVDYMCFNGKKIKASLYILKNIYKIEKLIVAHINLMPVAILAKIIKPNLKIYLTIYGREVWTRLPFYFRVFLKHINIFSISKYTTKQFCKLNGVSTNKIYYLPPDISLENRFTSQQNPYVFSDFNVLTVSRLTSASNYKGVDSMIKAIPIIIKSISNFKYTVIGKGDDLERLVSLSKKIGAYEYIDFKGYVESVEPYYKHCDLFSLPSKREGFGIVYLEAMKYKKPCIACDIGGQTDVVIENETGFLCKYDCIESISERVIRLFHDKEEINKFGEKGYEHLLNNFTYIMLKKRLNKYLGE